MRARFLAPQHHEEPSALDYCENCTTDLYLGDTVVEIDGEVWCDDCAFGWATTEMEETERDNEVGEVCSVCEFLFDDTGYKVHTIDGECVCDECRLEAIYYNEQFDLERD